MPTAERITKNLNARLCSQPLRSDCEAGHGAARSGMLHEKLTGNSQAHSVAHNRPPPPVSSFAAGSLLALVLAPAAVRSPSTFKLRRRQGSTLSCLSTSNPTRLTSPLVTPYHTRHRPHPSFPPSQHHNNPSFNAGGPGASFLFSLSRKSTTDNNVLFLSSMET